MSEASPGLSRAIPVPKIRRREEAAQFVLAQWRDDVHPPGWPRGTALSLADPKCPVCTGYGMVGLNQARGGYRLRACACAERTAFRAVMHRYHGLSFRSGDASTTKIGIVGAGVHGARSYGRPVEEFLADVDLAAKRVLPEQQWKVFRLRFVWRLELAEVARRLGLGSAHRAYHAADVVARRLGRTFVEMQPVALWPLDGYFE